MVEREVAEVVEREVAADVNVTPLQRHKRHTRERDAFPVPFCMESTLSVLYKNG